MSVRLPRVYLCGFDRVGWALDEAIRLKRLAHQGIAELTDLDASDVVFSLSWEAVVQIPARCLAGKHVLSYSSEDIRPCLSNPRSIAARAMIGCWLSASRQESARMERLGLRQFYVPWAVDTSVFRPLDETRAELRRRHRLPADAYLIGSFQRDTEGRDLRTPKIVKGPDVFAETLRVLRARGCPVHAVLAGPRRFWLRRRLTELGLPFTYVGIDEEGDDLRANTLPRSTLNELYQAIDVYCVSSRSEGTGPQAIVEAAAAGCAVVSPRVGLAADVLEPVSLIGAAAEAAERIEQDVRGGVLAEVVAAQRASALSRFDAPPITALLRGLYRGIEDIPVCVPDSSRVVVAFGHASRWQRVRRQLSGRRRRPRLTVSLWSPVDGPPYDGSLQFMLALGNALRARGVSVVKGQARANVHLLPSTCFDDDAFRRMVAPGSVPVVQRISSVVELAGGDGRNGDDASLRLNHDYASATTIVSEWCYASLLARGHAPRNAIIAPSAVDPAIFHAVARAPFGSRRKVRLIARAGSTDAPDEHATYRWLEQHLNWDRHELTVVGRLSEPLERARMLAPISCEEMAGLLRDHDVFVAASRHEACSEAVLEALACGLPVLYLNDAGHPELVGQGGLPFESVDDLLPQLERLIEDYDAYRTLIAPPTLDEVTDTYLALLQEIAA